MSEPDVSAWQVVADFVVSRERPLRRNERIRDMNVKDLIRKTTKDVLGGVVTDFLKKAVVLIATKLLSRWAVNGIVVSIVVGFFGQN